MLHPGNLVRLLAELVFVMLGLLLAWLAATGRYLFDPRRPAWIAMCALLIYWGLRTWRKTNRGGARGEARVGGGSLMLVGTLLLGMAWLPFAWVGPVLGAAGGILVLRGLVAAVLVARAH